MILDEYALVPDIFDAGTYSNPEVASMCLSYLRSPLMEEAVIANLRSGEWLQWVQANLGAYHQKAKNLIADLIKNGRVVMRSPEIPGPCKAAIEWCNEGLASNSTSPLTGVVAPQNLLPDIRRLAGPIETVERLNLATWWHPGSFSANTSRTIGSYLDVLRPVLRHANSVMFIDPYYDPAEPRYNDFTQILALMAGRRPAPVIEIHRVVSHGSGPARAPMPKPFWQSQFEMLSVSLRRVSLKAKVFLWDNFHDRFVITNHVGISMSNGFDTSADPTATVVWNRMNRVTTDVKQREFDPAACIRRCSFTIEIG